ncbi:MAG: glycosyltransferase family 25 protein [Opitutales bacterium]|nr:glycosyltransferase family 25 protein [Opitutales bacterium]
MAHSKLPDVYIISLARSQERRQLMTAQKEALIQAGYTGKITFFDAVDAADPQFAKKSRYSAIRAHISGKPLTPGEQACYASHYNLWELVRKFRNENDDTQNCDDGIIVMEDDVKISPEEFISAARACARSTWSCVRLATSKPILSYTITPPFFTARNAGGGAQAYFLRNTAARRFLKHSRKWVRPVDDFMDRYWQNDVEYILYYPSPISSFETESEIDAFPQKRAITCKSRSWWARPAKEIFRIFDKFRKNRSWEKFSYEKSLAL